MYDGTELDVVMIAIPEPQDDEMMSGFTEVKRKWSTGETDFGKLRTSPRRIERIPDGSLLIRPRSKTVEDLFTSFGSAYQYSDDYPIGHIQSRRGIYHDTHELWEVDFAYMPEWVFNRGYDGKHLPPDPRTQSAPRGDAVAIEFPSGLGSGNSDGLALRQWCTSPDNTGRVPTFRPPRLPRSSRAAFSHCRRRAHSPERRKRAHTAVARISLLFAMGVEQTVVGDLHASSPAR